MKRFISTTLVGLLLVGCGNDKRSSKYSPLTSTQRSQYSAFLESANDSVQAPIEVHKEKTEGKKIFQSVLGAVSSSYARTQMKESLHKGQCDIQYEIKKNAKGEPELFSPANGTGHYYLKVSGDTCPASMDANWNYSLTNSSLTASFAAKYTVKNDTYKNYNDVSGFDLSGSLSMSGDQNTAKGTGSVSGTMTSYKYGNVKVDLSLEMQSDKDKVETLMVLTTVFPTYTAEIRMIGEGKPGSQKFEYYLNGEKMDVKQGAAIQSLLNIPAIN